MTAGPLGIMQACLDVTLPYVHEREQFGKPIGEFQLIQAKLADMYATTQACRAFVYRTAQAADAGRADRRDCAAVILYAAERATRMSLDAIQVSSGPAQSLASAVWACLAQKERSFPGSKFSNSVQGTTAVAP